MLVADASLVVEACFLRFDLNDYGEFVAPPLLWPEARSVIHELAWRRSVDAGAAWDAHQRLAELPIRCEEPRGLGAEAGRIATELGWAKTYDAEYVALASLLDCRLVTVDGRLRRGADRLGLVVGPLEL